MSTDDSRTSPWPDGDPVIAVFKIGSEAHMQQFLSEGVVCMNTVEFFVNQTVGPRADPDEGAAFCVQASGARLSMQHDGVFQEIGELVGQLVGRSDATLQTNVLCLHARRGSSYDQPFQLEYLGFGERAVLLLNFDEFKRRLYRAAAEQYPTQKIRDNLVKYVDRATYNGPMDVFKKFSTYAPQQEWRFTATPGTGERLFLRLGNLSDIAMMFTTADRLRLTAKAAPKRRSHRPTFGLHALKAAVTYLLPFFRRLSRNRQNC